MQNLDELFKPASVAIVGASRRPGKIGHSVLANLLECGYGGEVYPINPGAEEIEGLKCYASVSEVGKPVDLAVLTVPASLALEVAEDCGRAGVKHLVVITAGFKEVGHEGLEREKGLVELCRKYGMRMVGPNCVGIIDTHTPLNVSFATGFPAEGGIAFLSQSGALCVSILDWSMTRKIGFSKFISVGNKADLNEADFIEDAAADPDTKVILCYLEDVSNGKQFMETAKRASRKTPIVVFKAGISEAGARAASSHTGALAGSNQAYDTAFRQCGVLRARRMDELFDLAVAFANQPCPKGNRVAIVTNSGGPGIITTDNVETMGLKMARFGPETIAALRKDLPAESNVYNPVDVIGSADADRYEVAMKTVIEDENVDSMIVLLTPTAVIDVGVTAERVKRVSSARPEKTVVTAFMGGPGVEDGQRILGEANIPSYTFPEPAVSALAGLTEYARRVSDLGEEEGLQVEGTDADAVRRVFEKVKREGRVVLLGSETTLVAEAYGISAAPSRLATTPSQATAIAESLGYPVVLKVASPEILHKTDVGGVKAGIESPEEVENTYVQILESVHKFLPDAAVEGIEVQKMMPQGTELIVGMTKDVQFGPLLAFGLGGIYVNLLKDVSFRLVHGLSHRDIEEMIRETKAYTVLRGFRGRERSDVPAIADTIARLAQLVTDFPQITEAEINPLFAYEKGVSALDFKITIS